MKTSTFSGKAKKPGPLPPNASSKLASLHTVWVRNVDAARVSPVFDALLRILKTRFRVATAMIFMSQEGAAVASMRVGADPAELDCAAALAACRDKADQLFVLEDAVVPDSNALPKSVRFYAGAPLVISPDGLPTGMLCLIDTKPRGFSREDRMLLVALANAVSAMMLMPYNPIAAQSSACHSAAACFFPTAKL